MVLIDFENIQTDMDATAIRHMHTVIVGLRDGYRGRSNAVKSANIERRLGIPGTMVRAIISELRKNGYPIGSCSKGYYWCNTQKELSTTIMSLRQRADEIMLAVNGMMNTKVIL